MKSNEILVTSMAGQGGATGVRQLRFEGRLAHVLLQHLW